MIEIESIIFELDKLDLSQEEKIHLAMLADSTLHSHILEAILSQLSEHEKEVFIDHFKTGDHDKTWQYLNEKVDKVQEKVKAVADQIKHELQKDIEEAKEESIT